MSASRYTFSHSMSRRCNTCVYLSLQMDDGFTLCICAHRQEGKVCALPPGWLRAEDEVADRQLHGLRQSRIEERRRHGLPHDHQLIMRNA